MSKFKIFNYVLKKQHLNSFCVFLSALHRSCGLVALSMASQTLCSRPIPSMELLDAAVKYGYTKQGEMFSG